MTPSNRRQRVAKATPPASLSSRPYAAAYWRQVDDLVARRATDELGVLVVVDRLSILNIPPTAEFIQRAFKLKYFLSVLPYERLDGCLLKLVTDQLVRDPRMFRPFLQLLQIIHERYRILQHSTAAASDQKCVYITDEELFALVPVIVDLLVKCPALGARRVVAALWCCTQTPCSATDCAVKRTAFLRKTLEESAPTDIAFVLPVAFVLPN